MSFLRCSHDRQLWQPTQSLRERERESKRAQSCVCVRLCAAVHLLTPIHACTQHTLTLTHTRYALNIRSAAALLCSAAAPIEIVACAAVELSVQFEQRYRAVWRPLSLSLSFSASKTFSLLKCPKAAATICKILLPAAAAVVVAANAQWALRAAAATTKV